MAPVYVIESPRLQSQASIARSGLTLKPTAMIECDLEMSTLDYTEAAASIPHRPGVRADTSRSARASCLCAQCI